MVEFPSSSLSLFFSLQPFCLQCIQTILSVLNPQRKIQWVILQQRKTSFSTSLSCLSLFDWCSENWIYVPVSLIAIVIQHLISSVLLTPLSPMVEVFFIKQLGNLESFLPDPWQSNVVTNLIKPLIQLNPIMQISVFRAVKILSGNLNVVRILNAWWLTFGFGNLLLWVTFCKQGSSWKSVDFKINFPRLCS